MSESVDYVEVSPNQILSVAAALINSLTISGGDLGSATDVLTLGTAYKTLKTVSSTWLGDINISLANYASTDGVTGVTLSSIGPLTANYSVTLSSYNDTVTIGKLQQLQDQLLLLVLVQLIH